MAQMQPTDNGVHVYLDGRTKIAREMRDRWAEVVNEVGGEDRLSSTQKSLIRRALFAERRIAEQEQHMAKGRHVDSADYARSVDHLIALFREAGISPGNRRAIT